MCAHLILLLRRGIVGGRYRMGSCDVVCAGGTTTTIWSLIVVGGGSDTLL